MEFKGTKGEFTRSGIHIRAEGNAMPIGMAYVQLFEASMNGSKIRDIEAEANAQLWASSKDLLESLQALRGFIDDIQPSCAAGEDALAFLKAKADAAIAKSELK